MGNRISLGKRSIRRPVEERFTRPQRLVHEPAYVDYKKLRKLILAEKLAPCYDGAEESSPELEECPICTYYFPSLNRSKCCMKGICTECFLQMKPSTSVRSAQCPFCKYSIYAVEYRGARTLEERRLEQAEEQKVIEAKIRKQFEESLPNQETTANQIPSGAEVLDIQQRPSYSDYDDLQQVEYSQLSSEQERIETTRPEVLDVDLEEIMIAEAIWRSMQDSDLMPRSTGGLDVTTHASNGRMQLPLSDQVETSSESATGVLAFAIARLAEQSIRQSDSFQVIVENDSINQTTDENFAGAADSCVQETVNPDDVGSNPSSSTDDEDSWGTLTASPNQTSGAGFVSDEEDVVENVDVSSCSMSSIHSISDRSFCGSPEYSDNVTGVIYSHPSATNIQRPLVCVSDIII